jgi:putative peptidoglycan lipid II flippase
MGNNGQIPSQPQQPLPPEQPGQQGYYGWQYDQDAAPAPDGPQMYPLQMSPAYPPSGQQPPPGYPPGYPPPAYPNQGQPGQPGQQGPQQYRPVPQRYQEPIQDMGSSLSYTQGMEFQYFDAPQPSQALPLLRQERLQQLREERLRRQQRRVPDLTSVIQRKGQKVPPKAPSAPLQAPPGRGPNAQPSMYAAPPPVQMSPAMAIPPAEVSPARPAFPSQAPQTQAQLSPARSAVSPAELESAQAPAQDTGMIQRARIGRATMILTGAFVASRFLGLVRTSMFAFVFGTNSVSDAYLQAFLIPDFIFNIVAGGALSSAFIPVFTHYMIAEQDEKTAWHIASAALNLAISIMICLAALAIIFAGQLVPLYNHGVPASEITLIIALTRIMLLQSIILGGGVIVNSVLNAKQDFLLPAIGTVLYNVGLIIGLLPGVVLAFHGSRNDTFDVYAASWGVVLGAVLQVAVQIPGLVKVGMRYKFTFNWKQPGVIQIGRQMVPRVINAGMLYFSTFVDRSLILLLVVVVGTDATNGLITQYYQAFQLVLLPLGIFGMAVSTAAFPTLAENVARGRFDRVRGTILETLRSILFMSVPSSVGLIILGLPVIQVLLEHGEYTLQDAQSTTIPLGFFAMGLAGLAAVEILTRSFYALRDSVTPVAVSIAQFILKIALALMLIDFSVLGSTPIAKGALGMGMLALSTSTAALLEAGTLLWLLHQCIRNLEGRPQGLGLRELAFFIGRILLASLAMAVVILIIRSVLDMILVTTSEQRLGFSGTLLAFIKLLIEIFAGFVVYMRVARILGVEELGPIRRVLNRLKLSWI